jgi:hypothetical protein
LSKASKIRTYKQNKKYQTTKHEAKIRGLEIISSAQMPAFNPK